MFFMMSDRLVLLVVEKSPFTLLLNILKISSPFLNRSSLSPNARLFLSKLGFSSNSLLMFCCVVVGGGGVGGIVSTAMYDGGSGGDGIDVG
jgi:hypothetical protein